MAGIDYADGLAFRARFEKIKTFDGGMSKVLLAKDNLYQRKVVVKFFDFEAEKKYKKKPQYDPQLIRQIVANLEERFELETEVSAQLNHPNSVRVYERGTIAGRYPFITLEFVDGMDLSNAIQAVRTTDRFCLEEFLLMFYQLCDPLETAHKKGIIHRDLKPGNVLLGKYGEIKVCDWGLAKKIDPTEVPKKPGQKSTSQFDLGADVKTMPGFRMATLSYVTPEQVREESVDQRTDVFLLTAILYEAIVGKPPYSAKKEDCLKRESEDDHSFDTNKLFVPGIREVVLKGMAVEKEDRYQTVTGLKTAAKEVLDDLLNEKIKIRSAAEAGILGRIFQRRQETQQEKIERMILSDIVQKWAMPMTKEDIISHIDKMSNQPTERSR